METPKNKKTVGIILARPVLTFNLKKKNIQEESFKKKEFSQIFIIHNMYNAAMKNYMFKTYRSKIVNNKQ
jgi:hypothetical protein